MPLLTANKLTKRYSGVAALSGVSFDLNEGEVHALVGENGAGKSTLCRILCGITEADEGSITMGGAALAAPEIELLFAQIRKLQAAGVGIIYVSHRMEEIRAITDRITVLRDGKWIATRPTSSITHEETVKLMVGRELSEASGSHRSA